jgi:glutamate dehydrogenase
VGERSRHGRGPDADACGRFIRRYYRHVAAEDVVGRDPVDVYGAAMSHKQLASHRPRPAAPYAGVHPDGLRSTAGAVGAHRPVEVVTDDMPFLVDS